MSDTVSLKIKIDDNFKIAEVHADDLRNAIKGVTTEAGKLNNTLINRNQIAQAFKWVTTAVRGLQSVAGELTGAYRVQIQAETRLEQVMRNTMGATNEEIQSIKGLAAEQQKLGVIGDEIILSGAQELATYMNKKESLEALIPVMTNMIAQQNEYGATTASAVSVAQMMGKVFTGETGALKRLGYTFTEAQGKILKYGTEEEKVAALTEVITPIVKDMNEALANTPEGKLVQANNRIGDIKETAGSIIDTIKVAALPMLNVVMEVLEGIAARAKEVADKIASSPIASKAADALRMIFTELESLTGKIFTALSPVLNVLVNAGGHFKAILEGTWKVVVEKVHPAIQKVTQSIARIVAGVVDWITSSEITMDIFRQGWVIISAISDIVSYIFNVLEKIINYVIIPIIRLIDMGYSKIKGYVTWIAGSVGKAASKFAQKMHPVVEWFGNLQDFVRRIVVRISGWLGNMVNPLIKFWNSISGRRVELISSETPDWLKGNKEKETFTIPGSGGGGEGGDDGSDEKEVNRRYKKAIQAAEAVQRAKENELKEKYMADGNKDEYDREMEKATIEGLERQLEIARKFKQDETKIQQQIADAKIQQSENEYGRQQNALAKHLDKEKLMLTNQLAEGIITQEEYDADIFILEHEFHKKQLDLAEAHHKETIELEQQIAEDRIRQREDAYERESVALQKSFDATEISLKKSLAGNIITQEQYDRAMLVAKARFYAAMLKLTQAYGKDDRQALKDVLDAQLDLQDYDKNQTKERRSKPFDTFSKGWGGLKGIGNSIRDIKDALTETDNAWDALTQTVDGFISMFQSIQQVTEIIDTITAATQTMQAASNAATQQELANAGTKVAANTAVAGSGAASAVAAIPLAGPALAIAAMISVMAALASLPKFANGGLVYGPTIGLMGEYGGAKSNPEVIAPLSRLRAMLGEGGGGHSEVKFRIEGRELVGIMNKQNNIYRRSE